MNLARGVAGVLLGFGTFLAIVHMLSGSLFVTIAGTIAAAMLGGYIAARIAGAHEFPYAAAVGMLMIGMSFLSMREEGASRPGWYQIAIAGCGPVSALLGAAIRIMYRR